MAMTYAKIDNGLKIAPQMITIAGRQLWGATAEQYAALGWLPLVETPQPEAVEGTVWVKSYAVADGAVAAVWTQQDAPVDTAALTESRIAALEEIIDAQAQALALLGVTEGANA